MTEEQEQVLIVAFIQGAKWWEWKKDGATMWQSDQAAAEAEARKRAEAGSLGLAAAREAALPEGEQ